MHYNWAPAILVPYVALFGNHDIVQIIHCRWCGLFVTQPPLSLLLSMTSFQMEILNIRGNNVIIQHVRNGIQVFDKNKSTC